MAGDSRAGWPTFCDQAARSSFRHSRASSRFSPSSRTVNVSCTRRAWPGNSSSTSARPRSVTLIVSARRSRGSVSRRIRRRCSSVEVTSLALALLSPRRWRSVRRPSDAAGRFDHHQHPEGGRGEPAALQLAAQLARDPGLGPHQRVERAVRQRVLEQGREVAHVSGDAKRRLGRNAGACETAIAGTVRVVRGAPSGVVVQGWRSDPPGLGWAI